MCIRDSAVLVLNRYGNQYRYLFAEVVTKQAVEIEFRSILGIRLKAVLTRRHLEERVGAIKLSLGNLGCVVVGSDTLDADSRNIALRVDSLIDNCFGKVPLSGLDIVVLVAFGSIFILTLRCYRGFCSYEVVLEVSDRNSL